MESHSTESSEIIGASGITEGEEGNRAEAKISAQGSESNGDANMGSPEKPSVEASETAADIGGEQSHGSSSRSIENPPAKKIKITKEAEHLLTARTEEKESIALLKTPAELLASFR
jgi:hypothetical protein